MRNKAEMLEICQYLALESRAIAFANEYAVKRQVIENNCGRTPNRERSRQQRVLVQAQVWLDFGCKFVAQIEKPASLKRQMTFGVDCLLFAPPVIQRFEELCLLVRAPSRQVAVFAQYQGVSRKSEQDVESAQFTALRGTLEQEGISRRMQLIEPS